MNDRLLTKEGLNEIAQSIYNKTSNMFVSKNRINSNVTLPIWGGDLVFDISGEIDNANSLKSIMLFRRYH